MGAASARLWRCCQWTAAFATLAEGRVRAARRRQSQSRESSLADESRVRELPRIEIRP